MAATKRKRRAGLAVQAKKPKRDKKDARTAAKQSDMAEEVEQEERNRIPGPVCKVETATLAWLRPPPRAPDYSFNDFGVAWVEREGSSVSAGLWVGLATTFPSNPPARARSGGERAG